MASMTSRMGPKDAAPAQPSSSGGWYYVPVDPPGPPLGPYDEAGLQGLVAGGFVQASTCVWREGCTSWACISEVEQLRHLLEHAPTVAAARPAAAGPGKPEAGPAGAAPGAAGAGTAPGASAPGPGASPAVPEDPDLAAFQAEIQAIEAEDLQEGDKDAGPATPEELEFEDDDGTWYIWDRALRKYVDKEMHLQQQQGAAGTAGTAGTARTVGALAEEAAASVSYDDMVYAGDDEIVPSLQAARAAEEAAAAEAEAAAKGKGKAAVRKRPAFGDGDPATTAAAGVPAAAPADGEDADADAAHAELLEAAGGPGKGKNKKARKAPPGQKAPAEAKPQAWFDLKVNTSVYVTGLPDDVTVPEVAEVFGKYGMIKDDEKGRPRIKIYHDKATGMPKGDALVTYLKEPSVHLAVQLLDGTPFRFNMGTKMTVSVAKFEMKGEAFQPKQGVGKSLRKKQILKQEKQLQWGGVDDKLPANKVTVIIKHMFAPEEFQENFLAAEELETDVKAECEKLGAVEKVRIFKSNPEGVVSVKFKAAEPAQQCVQKMNGRWFGGRQLEAHMYDGITNYQVKIKESWEEQEARLEAFARELEEQEDKERKAEKEKEKQAAVGVS